MRLGARCTSRALLDLGLSGLPSPAWRSKAQKLARQVLRQKAKQPNLWPERPSAQSLVVWCAYDLLDEDGSVWKEGCVVPSAPLDSADQDDDLLLPVFVEHDRSRHAERHALLKIIQKIQREGRCFHQISGEICLYAAHTPCISCLAVFCQFRCLFPHVRLNVQFDDWSTTRRALIDLDRR